MTQLFLSYTKSTVILKCHDIYKTITMKILQNTVTVNLVIVISDIVKLLQALSLEPTLFMDIVKYGCNVVNIWVNILSRMCH